MALTSSLIDTPIGKMIAVCSSKGICILDFPYRKMINTIRGRVATAASEEIEEGTHPLITELEVQLQEYFTGVRTGFDVPLDIVGSPFQLRVWEGLQQIPFGETKSYKQQSIFLGDEKAIRAVARANGENGLAIIIPCHRVIGENGSLTGYAGGLRAKQWLLDHERKHAGKTLQAELFAV